MCNTCLNLLSAHLLGGEGEEPFRREAMWLELIIPKRRVEGRDKVLDSALI